jgi:AraC-like DNA-binding protein
MDLFLNVVYKVTIMAGVRFARFYRTLASPVAVRVLVCAYNVLSAWEIDELSTPYWRLYWNDRPGAFVCINGERVELDSSKIVIIPPNVHFSTHLEGDVGQMYMHFWLGLGTTAPSFNVIVNALSARELSHVRWLGKLLRRNDAERDLTISLLAQLLITTLLVKLPAEHWDNWKVDAAIDRILARLHSASNECASNEALAEEAGLSVNTMLRRFRKATGSSPHQYLVRLRVEQASDLLRDTELTLDQIAERVGFCDRFHFSRAFRAVLDDSPAQFRKRHRDETRDAEEGRVV